MVFVLYNDVGLFFFIFVLMVLSHFESGEGVSVEQDVKQFLFNSLSAQQKEILTKYVTRDLSATFDRMIVKVNLVPGMVGSQTECCGYKRA